MTFAYLHPSSQTMDPGPTAVRPAVAEVVAPASWRLAEVALGGPNAEIADVEHDPSRASDVQVVDLKGKGSNLHPSPGVSERAQVVGVLQALEERLRAVDQSTLEIEAWVKNRGDNDQIVYLAVRAADVRIVAHDQSGDFRMSLVAARNDLRRQLTDARARRSGDRR